MDTGKSSVNGGALLWHALVWLGALYLYIQILGFDQANITNPILWGLYFVQLGVHEVAHMVLMFLPPILTAAAGSFSEVVFTSLVVLAAWRGGSWWGVVFGLLWVMMAFMSMGNYMADASAQAMPLVGPGADPIHDWNFVFTELGWLEYDQTIGMGAKIVGGIVGAAGLFVGIIRVLQTLK